MSRYRRIAWPIGAGFGGMILLMAVYFGIISWAESPAHAANLFLEDWRIVVPIIVGFGIQSDLYAILKKRLFIPVPNTGPAGALTGAGGVTSTIAMAACCAHHVTDVLPILGLTTAAVFLAEYRIPFMIVGLATNLIGIAILLVILFRKRRKAIRTMTPTLKSALTGAHDEV